MKVLEIQRFDRPEAALRLAAREPGTLGEGEVRLRVLASPINPADLNLIEGTYGVKPELPAVAGIEGIGEVVESADPGWEIGARAMFLRGIGWWTEEVRVAAADLFPLPGGVEARQAAMLRVNPATAWRMLHDFETLEAGDWVIQNAANSGVGRAVIQLAGKLGLKTINLVRSGDQIAELEALGGTRVWIDGPDAVDAARDELGGAAPRLALNAVGGESALRLMNALAPGGTHVTYGAMARMPLKVPNGLLIFKDLRIRGFWLSRWAKSAPATEIAATYQTLAAEMAAGRLVLPVDAVYALDEFREALARVADPDSKGKVLLIPGGPDR